MKTIALSADAFDREVALLGQSERFMSFLQDRSKETGGTPLAEGLGPVLAPVHPEQQFMGQHGEK